MEIRLEMQAAVAGDVVTLTPKAGGDRPARTPNDIVVTYANGTLDTSAFKADADYEVIIRRR